MITIEPDGFYVGMWQAAIKGGDFMAVMYLNREEKHWEALYRFRYHKDDKVFGSADSRNWYKITMSDDTTDAKLRGIEALNSLVKIGMETGHMFDFEYIEVEGNGQKWMEAMMDPKREHVFMRSVTEQEAREKYGATDEDFKRARGE